MNPCNEVRYAVTQIKNRAKMPSSMKFGGSKYYNMSLVAYKQGLDYPRTFHECRGRKFFAYVGKIHVGETKRSAGYRRWEELCAPHRSERLAAKLNRECYTSVSDQKVGCV